DVSNASRSVPNNAMAQRISNGSDLTRIQAPSGTPASAPIDTVPTSRLSACRQAFGTSPTAVMPSINRRSGAAVCGPIAVLASGTKISALPKPEKPRARAATKAESPSRISAPLEWLRIPISSMWMWMGGCCCAEGVRIRRWPPAGNTNRRAFVASDAAALLPSGRNGHYDRPTPQYAAREASHDQGTNSDHRRRPLFCVSGRYLLRRTAGAGAGHAGGDYQDRITNLRRQELRCSRAL